MLPKLALSLIFLTSATLTTAQVRTCVWPQYPNDRFLFPPTRCNNGNYTGLNSYPVGTKLTVRWTSPTKYVTLYLYQEWGGTEALKPLLVNTSLKAYDFNGYPPQRLALSNTFYFVIYKVNSTAAFLASDYFNITGGASKTVSSVVTSVLPASVIVLSSQSLVTVTPSGSPTPSISSDIIINSSNNTNTTNIDNTTDNDDDTSDKSTNNGDGNSTTSRNIGIGISIGLASFAAIIALSIYFFIYRPKRKAARELARFQQQPQFYNGKASRQSITPFSEKEVLTSPPVYWNSQLGQNTSYVTSRSYQESRALQMAGPGSGVLAEMEQPGGDYELTAATSRSELIVGRTE